METIPTGALNDPRSVDQKQLDYTHQEVLGGEVTATVWQVKPWVTLDIRHQSTSSSCGGQSGAKALTAFTGTIASATPIYDSRSNYPTEGMYMQEIGSLMLHNGTGSEEMYPSENLTEDQINALKQVYSALPLKISAYYTIAVDINLIAQALDKGHAVILGLSSNIDEWTAIPTVIPSSALTFSHFVCCHSKNFGNYNGEQVLCIDDSCNLSSTLNESGQRLITNDFLTTRVWGVLGLIPVVPTVIIKPSHAFTKNLSLGMTDPDVKALQDILKYEGFFPKEIASTGFFGSITKAAVIKFQTAHATECLVPAGINTGVGTGYVGPYTIKYLNSQYAS
jgi:hypothetical protein